MSITFEISGGTGWIRIDRPARLNALDAAALDAMGDAIVRGSADSGVRALVLIGEGGVLFPPAGPQATAERTSWRGAGSGLNRRRSGCTGCCAGAPSR